uniref:Uncharacterized protein n=1 Tax=Anopheles dirus TaxID=7168 RepID=A0A182NYF2_9DIPT
RQDAAFLFSNRDHNCLYSLFRFSTDVKQGRTNLEPPHSRHHDQADPPTLETKHPLERMQPPVVVTTSSCWRTPTPGNCTSSTPTSPN